MAKSRRVKAVEAQKSSGKKNAKKPGTSPKMAGKVLKSKNAKLPVKTINKKESTPKNSKITKEPVKKSAESKSSTKKLDPVVDESPKKQSSKMAEVRSLFLLVFHSLW